MSKLIFCKKLLKDAPAMKSPPFPGELGLKIYQEISEEAWKMWINHQTMLINEYRLHLVDPKARTFLKEEMQKFFFEGGSEVPAGYKTENL